MDHTPLTLTSHTYGTITPEQVTHRLTEDGWSTFDYGPFRVTVPVGDLTQVRAARRLAQAIEARAGFWDTDLAAIEARLVAAEQAATRPPAPEPFGEDPELDTKVSSFAAIPETHRKTKDDES